MEIISLIFSGLALLAAMACLVLVIRNEKRSEKRRAALIDYVDTENLELGSQFHQYVDEKFSGEVIEKIKKLEAGITPDYEQAKIAADAVNSFNRGITNILGFDPVAALQTERKKESLGEVRE